ncbi:MAG TPA: hypothetical protein VGA00_07360 [Acidiferrobacterales bacterium]
MMRVDISVIAAALAASLLAVPAGQAAVTGVAASPSGARVPVARAVSVSAGWSVTTNSAGGVTLSSAQGVFRTPSAVTLATVNKPLTQTVAGPGTATITERVLVPADIIKRAQQAGATQIIYERSFDDGGGAATGQIVLSLATAAAASFSLSRLELGFDDGKPLRVVRRGDALKPRAEVAAVGAGMLRGVWEIAGPGPAAGDAPEFRALEPVTRALGAGDAVTLTGPKLPTDTAGLYQVRLRVERPEPGFELPVLRYVVGADNKN